MTWGFRNRPAPTVLAAGVHGASGVEIFDRGARSKLLEQIRAGEASGNGRIVNPDTPLDPVRLLPAEAATLQTYPTDFPFAGNKGKVFQQIGNAVPPLLAQHILEALWAEPSVAAEVIELYPDQKEANAA